MNPAIKIYDLYCKTLSNCYYYKDQNDKKNLLNEIGVLRGLEQALRILNIGVANVEYNKFIELQNKIIDEI